MTRQPTPWVIEDYPSDPPRYFVNDATGRILAIFIERDDAEYVVELINATNEIGEAIHEYADRVKESQ